MKKSAVRRISFILLNFALDFVRRNTFRAVIYTLPTLPQAGGLLHRQSRCLAKRFLKSS
jgi:hypothetical protein